MMMSDTNFHIRINGHLLYSTILYTFKIIQLLTLYDQFINIEKVERQSLIIHASYEGSDHRRKSLTKQKH